MKDIDFDGILDEEVCKSCGIVYVYGMRLREYGIGCQPMKGLVYYEYTCEGNEYYSYLFYDRKLADEEMKQYDLDFLTEIK